MKRGYLSQYFDGIAIKRLSEVEANTLCSNQHEFNGVEGLRKILGEPESKVQYPAKFLYLTDYDDDPIIEDGFLTWYDARQKARVERGVNRWEYRLYFPTNNVSQCATTGDLLIIAKRPDDSILAIVAAKDTTISEQLKWLFGYSEQAHPGFSVREELDTDQDRIQFASRFILENIGVDVETREETWLDEMLRRFDGRYPSTREFSSFARLTLDDTHSSDGIDEVLMAWMEREEVLFRTLERYLIADRLRAGFDTDVDGFLSFSLSVQNRRKSRVGLALENHVEQVFRDHSVKYSRTAVTENKSKPDFIFPGQAEYHDPNFSSVHLTMLGIKSTCKDRWRQVLSEAARIERKHLLTLEAAISQNQTSEMAAKNLQLVLPRGLHQTYTSLQRPGLMDVSQFVQLVLERQSG